MAKSGIPRLLFTSALVVGLAAGGWYWWSQRSSEPVRYITTPVTRATLTQAVTATGDLQPVTTVEVSSQISGLVLELLVDFNSPVKAGQVLARIDPATYESRLRQSRAEFSNSRANYDLVRLNTDRVRSLFERNLVSQQELDQANAQLSQAQAQLEIRQAAVENVEVDLARCEIIAPIDGIVIDRKIEVGKTVAASLNAPTLFTIANDLTRMQINASVAEADIGQIADGQPVNFTVDAFPDRRFTGTVAQIRNFPTVASNVVVYPVIIDVVNPGGRLKPGMTANVDIVIAERPAALTLPNAALRVRVPEGVTVLPAAAVTNADPAAPAALPPADRDTIRALMTEAGFAGGGPPSPEVMARVRELAAARGLSIPDRGGARSGGAADSRPTTRTLYTLVGEGPTAKLQALTVVTGITDGSRTEVLSGLEENTPLVTTIIAPNATSATNPFGSARRF
jgi:HlyD family secretion protein